MCRHWKHTRQRSKQTPVKRFGISYNRIRVSQTSAEDKLGGTNITTVLPLSALSPPWSSLKTSGLVKYSAPIKQCQIKTKNANHFLLKKGKSPFTPIQHVERQLLQPEGSCDYVGWY